MIYLKRFLYIFIIIILGTLIIPIIILYIVFIPFGMIISFVLTEDLTRYFNSLSKLEEYFTIIDDKLESIFLK
jgi:hypothetical protein